MRAARIMVLTERDFAHAAQHSNSFYLSFGVPPVFVDVVSGDVVEQDIPQHPTRP
jgi:hypothetical protein